MGTQDWGYGLAWRERKSGGIDKLFGTGGANADRVGWLTEREEGDWRANQFPSFTDKLSSPNPDPWLDAFNQSFIADHKDSIDQYVPDSL